MKHWDPHFHLWDVSPGTSSGHDADQLAAVDGNPVYDRACYESDLAVEGFELTGGALVETAGDGAAPRPSPAPPPPPHRALRRVRQAAPAKGAKGALRLCYRHRASNSR